MKNKLSLLSLILPLTFTLFSCGGSETTEYVADLSNIILNNSDISLGVGDSFALTSEFYDMTSKEKTSIKCNYESLDASVASIDENGVITAISSGTAIIRATYKTYKSLATVNVIKKNESQFLNLVLNENKIELYESDQYQLEFETLLNDEYVASQYSFSDYDKTILNVSETGLISTIKEGSSIVNVSASYNNLKVYKAVSINVNKSSYIISPKVSSEQIIVGEDDLDVSFTVSYGKTIVENVLLSNTTSLISDTTFAKIEGEKIVALKKGYVTLDTTYYSSAAQEQLTCSICFRVREKYQVTYKLTGQKFSVLDGDYAEEHPLHDDSKFTFDSWLLDGEPYDEPIEKDMEFDVRWRVNEFDFAASNYDARTEIDTETITSSVDATYHADKDDFYKGLDFSLGVTQSQVEPSTATNQGLIYMPKMNYSNISKVTYNWGTNGWSRITDSSWYAGGNDLGGILEIVHEGNSLVVTLQQTLDRKDPFNGTSYKNAKVTKTIDDENVLNGNKSFVLMSYHTYEEILAPCYFRLSYPYIISNEVEPLFPDFSSRTYGAIFAAKDDKPYYAAEDLKPIVIPTTGKNGNYLYYRQDSSYIEPEYVHEDIDYTFGLPILNYSKFSRPITMEFTLDTGIYMGIDTNVIGDNSVETNGYFLFSNISDTSMEISIYVDGSFVSSINVTDVSVINGESSFIMPTFYIYYRFSRCVKLYEPQYESIE